MAINSKSSALFKSYINGLSKNQAPPVSWQQLWSLDREASQFFFPVESRNSMTWLVRNQRRLFSSSSSSAWTTRNSCPGQWLKEELILYNRWIVYINSIWKIRHPVQWTRWVNHMWLPAPSRISKVGVTKSANLSEVTFWAQNIWRHWRNIWKPS